MVQIAGFTVKFENFRPPIQGVKRPNKKKTKTTVCLKIFHGMFWSPGFYNLVVSHPPNDSCLFLHRKRCSVFMKWGNKGERGCEKDPCDKLHPTVCQKSLDLECLDRDVQRCKRPHQQGKEVEVRRQTKTPSTGERQAAGRRPPTPGRESIGGRSVRGPRNQGAGPAVWQHQPQSGFDIMTVQHMLEAYSMGLRREMLERQADLAGMVRQE